MHQLKQISIHRNSGLSIGVVLWRFFFAKSCPSAGWQENQFLPFSSRKTFCWPARAKEPQWNLQTLVLQSKSKATNRLGLVSVIIFITEETQEDKMHKMVLAILFWFDPPFIQTCILDNDAISLRKCINQFGTLSPLLTFGVFQYSAQFLFWQKACSPLKLNLLLRFCWHPWLPLPGGAEEGAIREACWYLGMWWASTSPWAKTKTKTDTKIIWEAWWYLGVWCTSTHPWSREHF